MAGNFRTHFVIFLNFFNVVKNQWSLNHDSVLVNIVFRRHGMDQWSSNHDSVLVNVVFRRHRMDQ